MSARAGFFARMLALVPGRSRAKARRSLDAALTPHYLSSWSQDDSGINADTASGLRIARNRCRQAARNNDYARHFLRMAVTNIIGPAGIGHQADLSKRSGERNESINVRIEAAWAEWGALGNCEATGRLGWLQVQQLLIRHAARDGEILVRLLPNRGPHAFQIQVLDPAVLDVELRKDLGGGRRIRQGIEIDEEGRPLAYHLLTDPVGEDAYAHTLRRHVRVPAAEIIHAFVVEEAQQLRGLPWMSSALARLHMVHDYERAATNAARNAAKRAGFFITKDGAPPPIGGTSAEDNGEAQVSVTQDGQFDTLPEGVTFENFTSDYPHTNYAEFVKSSLRGAACGLGVSYPTFGNDLEAVNYSSARVGVLDEREVWKGLQSWFIDTVVRRIYAEWMRYALLAVPVLQPLGYDKLAIYQLAVKWTPRRWAWVDPLKERAAQELALELGLTSRRRIIAEQGEDPDEIRRELEEEADWPTGVAAPPAPKAAPANAAQDPEDEQGTAQEGARLRVLAGGRRSLEIDL